MAMLSKGRKPDKLESLNLRYANIAIPILDERVRRVMFFQVFSSSFIFPTAKSAQNVLNGYWF